MQPGAHYRGTRGGEKARKKAFYEDSDSVKNAQRRIFPRVPWRRVDWSEATAAVVQAFQQIAAAPTDPTLPAWQIVAQFNAALLPHLPAPQPAAVAGAAVGAPRRTQRTTINRTRTLQRTTIRWTWQTKLKKQHHRIRTIQLRPRNWRSPKGRRRKRKRLYLTTPRRWTSHTTWTTQVPKVRYR